MIIENKKDFDDSIVRCDSCKKDIGSINALEDNWGILNCIELGLSTEQEKMHFCDFNCLKSWVEAEHD